VDEAPHLFDFFLLNVLQRVEVFHLGGNLAGEVARIEAGDARYTALASQQGLPYFICGIAHAADEPQARDYDPASVVQLFSRLGVLADIVELPTPQTSPKPVTTTLRPLFNYFPALACLPI